MSNDTAAPATIDLSWDELAATVAAAGDGVFLATAGDRPHVAWVMPGWGTPGRLWVATFASSQKARNLRRSPHAAMTCAPTPQDNVLIRATARLVTDPAEAADLWAGGVLPYDPAAFFQGPDDPELLFVELVVDGATVHELGPAPVRRWQPAA
jgi:general stress protein 26